MQSISLSQTAVVDEDVIKSIDCYIHDPKLEGYLLVLAVKNIDPTECLRLAQGDILEASYVIFNFWSYFRESLVLRTRGTSEFCLDQT